MAAATAAVAVLGGITACGGGSTGVGTSVAQAAPDGPATTRPTASATPPTAVDAAAPAPLARSVPVRLLIPAIGVDTPVMTLGLNADGTVQVPPIEAHAPAGWYRGSPTPGQTGPSVILAHVTVGQFGDGVFLHLSLLKPGDRVTVRLADGATAVFSVFRMQTVAKAQFPAAEVYGNVDRPELHLITCGGPRTGHGYLDNVLVFAALVSTTG